jgi:hypothetical protein
MKMRAVWAIVFSYFALGCAMSVEEQALEESATATEPTASLPAEVRAAGWLTHFEGAVDPLCHASLVSPSSVLTAAGCLEDTYPTAYSFSVAGDPARPVEITRELRMAQDWVVLELEAPLEWNGAPFDAGGVQPGDVLQMLSFVYVIRGESLPPPMRWTAEVVEVSNDTFTADLIDGAPGCHGDLGAAAFHDGEIAGVLVGTRSGGPLHPSDPVCRSRYVFSKVRSLEQQ